MHEPDWANPPIAVERKHSGPGIASFILSILCGFFTFALFAVAGFIQINTPGGMDERSPAAMVIGLGIFGVGFLDLIAVGLAIGGLFQPDRKPLFAVLGLLFSLLIITGTVGVIALGMMMK